MRYTHTTTTNNNNKNTAATTYTNIAAVADNL